MLAIFPELDGHLGQMHTYGAMFVSVFFMRAIVFSVYGFCDYIVAN